MRISADGKDQPALRDIAFVTPFAKKSSKSRANPDGTATSEIPGTLYERAGLGLKLNFILLFFVI